jgi:hypothetical protein
MLVSVEPKSMIHRQRGERPARRVPHRVRTRYRFASHQESPRGSVPPLAVARRHRRSTAGVRLGSLRSFHVKHRPSRPGWVRILRAYRYRAPCLSRPCRIAAPTGASAGALRRRMRFNREGWGGGPGTPRRFGSRRSDARPAYGARPSEATGLPPLRTIGHCRNGNCAMGAEQNLGRRRWFTKVGRLRPYKTQYAGQPAKPTAVAGGPSRRPLRTGQLTVEPVLLAAASKVVH